MISLNLPGRGTLSQIKEQERGERKQRERQRRGVLKTTIERYRPIEIEKQCVLLSKELEKVYGTRTIKNAIT